MRPQAPARDGLFQKGLFQLRWRPSAPGRGNSLGIMACGVGFIAELNKVPTRSCVVNALEMLLRMTHRGACGCEVNSGASPAAQTRSNARDTAA